MLTIKRTYVCAMLVFAGATPAVTQNEGRCSDVLYYAGRNEMNVYTRRFLDRAMAANSLSFNNAERQAIRSASGGFDVPGFGSGFGGSTKQQYDVLLVLQSAARAERTISDEEMRTFSSTVSQEAIAAWNYCIAQRSGFDVDFERVADEGVTIHVEDGVHGAHRLSAIQMQPTNAFNCEWRYSAGSRPEPRYIEGTTIPSGGLSLTGRAYNVFCRRRSDAQAHLLLELGDPQARVHLVFDSRTPADSARLHTERALGGMLLLSRSYAERLRYRPVDQVWAEPSADGSTGSVRILLPDSVGRGIDSHVFETRGWSGIARDSSVAITINGRTETLKPGGECLFRARSDIPYRLVYSELDISRGGKPAVRLTAYEWDPPLDADMTFTPGCVTRP